MKKIIVITGGSDGLGKEIALILSKNHQLVLIAKEGEKLKKTAQKLNCDYITCDLSDLEQIKNTVKQIIEKYHQIDVLINNAGIWIQGEVDQNDEEHIKKTFEINSLATIYMTKYVIPYMKNQKQGFIINVISQAGLTAKADRSVYHASKWAITGFTKCLQYDLKKHNIKVTGFYPGAMKTKLFEKVGVNKNLSNALDPKKAAQMIEYIINQDSHVMLPEIGVIDINY